MLKRIEITGRKTNIFLLCIFFLFLISSSIIAQSLDIPSSKGGISFGNSKYFNGLRFNFRDSEVDKINGLNVTLWTAKNNNQAVVNGFSLGIAPSAGSLNGLNIGFGGVAAGRSLNGISLGVLGIGSGNEMSGIMIGGLGAGSGGNVRGIVLGGLGAGSGGNIQGIGLGLLGVGAGGNLSGVMIGGIGVGAGGDANGIMISGLGAGVGGNFNGLGIGGIGMGCGGHLKGVAIGGIYVGAPKLTGLIIGGLGTYGKDITGAALALGAVIIEDGTFKGGALSAFNFIKGEQRGVTLGIVNYAYRLHGIQIGLINYVRDNPFLLKIMPLINFNFRE